MRVGPYKESWELKNWCFWNAVLEKALESPLNSPRIKPVSPWWKQSWLFIGRTDAKAEAPIFWPPDMKDWLIGKEPDAGKDWGEEEKGTTEDEMVGWHHWLHGHEFEQDPGVADRQGSHAAVNRVTKIPKQHYNFETVFFYSWFIGCFELKILKFKKKIKN